MYAGHIDPHLSHWSDRAAHCNSRIRRHFALSYSSYHVFVALINVPSIAYCYILWKYCWNLLKLYTGQKSWYQLYSGTIRVLYYNERSRIFETFYCLIKPLWFHLFILWKYPKTKLSIPATLSSVIFSHLLDLDI